MIKDASQIPPQPREEDTQGLLRDLAALSSRLQGSVRLMSVISRLSDLTVKPMGLTDAAGETLETLVTGLEDIDSCSVLIHDEDAGLLKLLSARGQADLLGQDEQTYNLDLAFQPGEGIAGRVFSENKPYFWYQGDPQGELPTTPGADSVPQALASLPLTSWERRVGVLNISFLTAQPFAHNRRRDLVILSGVVANILQTFMLREALDHYAVSLVMQIEEKEREIAERRKVEASLRESEERHRTVLEASPDPIIVQDSSGRITYVNPAFTQLFGWSAEEVETAPRKFVPEREMTLLPDLTRRIGEGRIISGLESRRTTKDGRILEVSLSAASFFDSQGEPRGSIITLQDITERKLAQKQLEFIAYHDTLTSLPNRKSFYLRLEEDLAKAERDNRSLALFFLDVDRFKDVNDTLGHDAGDQLLKDVGTRISQTLPEGGELFRLGGDEFTVILPGPGDRQRVAEAAGRINLAVAAPFSLSGQEVKVSASIGAAVFPEDGGTVETLVKHADMAMYEAKQVSDTYRFFNQDINQRATLRLRLERDLLVALNQGQMVLHYQPIYHLELGLVGMEALLRWEHPELGLLLPAQFLRLAEQTGIIANLDQWVLGEACRQMVRWASLREGLMVTVNLSVREFTRPSWVERVEEVLAASGLPPHRLMLELTERLIMENPAGSADKLERLANRGVRFALDDFGAGSSSLQLLRRLPLEALKIDRSFVAGAEGAAPDREIIQAIVAMTQNLGLIPMAEGVETEAQKDFLAGLGCRVMQGHLFGAAQPVSSIDKLLAKP